MSNVKVTVYKGVATQQAAERAELAAAKAENASVVLEDFASSVEEVKAEILATGVGLPEEFPEPGSTITATTANQWTLLGPGTYHQASGPDIVVNQGKVKFVQSDGTIFNKEVEVDMQEVVDGFSSSDSTKSSSAKNTFILNKSNKYVIVGGSVTWTRIIGGWTLKVTDHPTLILPEGGYALLEDYEGVVSQNTSFVYLTSDIEGTQGFNPIQTLFESTTKAYVQVTNRTGIADGFNDANIPLVATVSTGGGDKFDLYTIDGFDDFKKIIQFENHRIDFHISASTGFYIKETSSGVVFNIVDNAVLFDPYGGYRFIKPSNNIIPDQHTVYLSASEEEYVKPLLGVKGIGESLFIWHEPYNAKNYNKMLSFPLGMVWNKRWNPLFPSLIKTNEVSEENIFELKNILPFKSFDKSPIIKEIASFVKIWNERKSDVTIVQIGDSISTNLDYTTSRADANERPPMMTENNLNSFIEEKLRWKEQKYRRYDFPLIFTEILGGGTSNVISNEDETWGYTGVGTNFYLPLTKCIDGGTNSGVSYEFPSGMRRCNLVIHTDFKWSIETQIKVTEGNDKVEVFDESDNTWKEANGFVFSGKEANTLFVNGSESYHRNQYQKRINMRSLSDLSAKTITVQNIGSGRFGYWGIEYSPRQYMFNFIASSKGGHSIKRLEVFEEWMVDAFKPDLVLQQCCVINEGAQTGVRPDYPVTTSPTQFASSFESYYNRLHQSKGYLVVPYILFVGMQAGLVNPITGEWGVGTHPSEGAVTIPDYIGSLVSMYLNKNAPLINLFNDFLEIAEKKSIIEETNNIYKSAIQGSGKKGDTFTIDGVHLNDYGNLIAKRLIDVYFNF